MRGKDAHKGEKVKKKENVADNFLNKIKTKNP